MVLIVTTDSVPGREIARTLGLVHSNAIRARHIGSDIGAGLKNLVGGRIGGYEKLLNETRDLVVADISQRAQAMGADAIVAFRMATSDVMQGASEILAYGTAVQLR